MLLGKGVHGLQELGVLPLAPIPFVEFDLLGLFPDAWPVVPQLTLGFAAFFYLRRKVTPRAGPQSVTTRPGPTAT